jgi:Anti-sigma-K factor rskA, C-terminal
MARDHDDIEELLAGYVLGGLSGEDAARADTLLTEHVPGCPMCRDTLSDFQAVTGDLALAAPARRPPDTLLPRLRRELAAPGGRGRGGSRRTRSITVLAAAASFAAILAVGGLAMSMMGRASKAESQRKFLQDAIQTASAAGVSPVSMAGQGSSTSTPEQAPSEITSPDRELILYCQACPDPQPGEAYRVWLGSNGSYTYRGQFVPDGGWVGIRLPIDTSRYDEILITEEPIDQSPSNPALPGRWSASLR